jgi:hypothetical protein
MAILDVMEAKHFCGGYAGTMGAAQGSFRQWARTLAPNHTISEGTPLFDEYRDIALREVERLLFLAASQYRRSFDLQITSASSWAHVTLYYGAFFSAQAILGIFGTWKLRDKYILDVDDGTPGQQRFVVRSFPHTFRGEHRRFWEYFYSSVVALLPWIDPSLQLAITPVNANPTWQIDTRNDINYDTHEAMQLMSAFQQGFRSSRLRSTLPGVLSTQFQVMEGLLQLAVKFARDNRIATDALGSLQPTGNRRKRVAELVFNAPRPNNERHIRKSVMR